MNMFKTIETPILNIESFGLELKDNYDTRRGNKKFVKCYIPSLEYNIKSLFGNSTKQIYIPLIFENETEIKGIMKYYSDMYFIISILYGYDNTHYSDAYPISEYYNIDEILEKERKEINKEGNKILGINIKFCIKYQDFSISINSKYIQYNYYSSRYNEFSHLFEMENTIISENGQTNCIELIKKSCDEIPFFKNYTISLNKEWSRECLAFKEAIQYIKDYMKTEKEKNDELDSMYSKKTFKLIEE